MLIGSKEEMECVSVVKGEERVVQNKIALVAGLVSYPLPQQIPSQATLSRNSYVK